MKNKVFLGLALIIAALLAFTPATAIAASVAGSDQAISRQQNPYSNTNPQIDQRIQATVTGIDQPEGCLRIRQGPSTSSKIIGCAEAGEKLRLRGNYSNDGRWAELADNGWVFASQIDAPNKPKVQRPVRRSYAGYDTTDSSTESDSSLWRESPNYYDSNDGGFVSGGAYGYGARFGFFPGGGHRGGGHRGGGHHGSGHRGGGHHGSGHRGGGHHGR